jgi:hypothetical protein
MSSSQPRTVSAHQPAYLPWLGYFDKIARSEVFIFMDTVQFEKNSFTNRNRIKTDRGPLWLTVPVKAAGHLSSTMLDIEVDEQQKWRDKHLKSIAQYYRKAPHFSVWFPRLEALYAQVDATLPELCFRHLGFWLEQLGITTQIVRLRDLTIDGKKSDLVLNLCRHFGAAHYISGALGRDYLDLESFSAAGIGVEFQDYRHPVYPQLNGEFLPNMAVIDAVMNVGEEARQFFVRPGR